MPMPTMLPIKPLRINGIQPTHAPAEVTVRRLQEQVIVSTHQTIGMTAPVLLLDFSSEQRQEPASILVGFKDRLPCIALDVTW